MVHFDVPGWSVPGAPVAVPSSKKRKRPQALDHVQSATVNVEKLMKRLATEQSHTSVTADTDQSHKKKRKRKVEPSHPPARGDGEQSTPKKKRKERQKKTGEKGTPLLSPASPHRPLQPSGNALTTLQRGMKQSLDGARFRYVNHPHHAHRTPPTMRHASQVDQ